MLLMSSDYYINPVKADSPSLEAMTNLRETVVDTININLDAEEKTWHEQYRRWVCRTNQEAHGLLISMRTPVREVTVKFHTNNG
mmetsp:Transcript_14873/g.34655  ORF Transcript_14873/g.34655 Transcript_14873/m.34655 type:complete len:84 (+) Transcript_14873:486-737(+)